jgi:hypothetical protein
MGTISGSAVANVTATGVFTIPLMRRAGLSAERAGATEAIASTGGQLMPPIMGVAAFVMAELLVVPYAQIALAGLIPALAFYVALFLGAHLHACRTGLGTLSRAEIGDIPPILPGCRCRSPSWSARSLPDGRRRGRRCWRPSRASSSRCCGRGGGGSCGNCRNSCGRWGVRRRRSRCRSGRSASSWPSRSNRTWR